MPAPPPSSFVEKLVPSPGASSPSSHLSVPFSLYLPLHPFHFLWFFTFPPHLAQLWWMLAHNKTARQVLLIMFFPPGPPKPESQQRRHLLSITPARHGLDLLQFKTRWCIKYIQPDSNRVQTMLARGRCGPVQRSLLRAMAWDCAAQSCWQGWAGPLGQIDRTETALWSFYLASAGSCQPSRWCQTHGRSLPLCSGWMGLVAGFSYCFHHRNAELPWLDKGTRNGGNSQPQEIMLVWKMSKLNREDTVQNSRCKGHGTWEESCKWAQIP